MNRVTWRDRLAMTLMAVAILAAFAGCMAVAGALGPDHGQTCTSADVNQGVDRCQPDYPPELPSGTD